MTESNGGKSVGPAPELHAVGAIDEPRDLDSATAVVAQRVIGLQGPGARSALFGGVIVEAGQPYLRVTDLTTVPVGARLRRDHPNHMSTTLTVVGAYGKHGRPATDGLLCHVEAHKGDGWDTVLTPSQTEDSVVWLLSTPTSEGDTNA